MWIVSKAVGDPIRIQGLKDSSLMLKSYYKELKVWEKFYQLCLVIYRGCLGDA